MEKLEQGIYPDVTVELTNKDIAPVLYIRQESGRDNEIDVIVIQESEIQNFINLLKQFCDGNEVDKH